ncbi:hypothetical protein QBC44DRAFT_308854 [Cladorrhinum sp. PSN332]|nr:hypothetical protein QBC44DRAFT_308854 [Cladorrhinum sp. PSN332]
MKNIRRRMQTDAPHRAEEQFDHHLWNITGTSRRAQQMGGWTQLQDPQQYPGGPVQVVVDLDAYINTAKALPEHNTQAMEREIALTACEAASAQPEAPAAPTPAKAAEEDPAATLFKPGNKDKKRKSKHDSEEEDVEDLQAMDFSNKNARKAPEPPTCCSP